MSNFKEYGRISSEINVSYVGSKNTAVAKFSIAVKRNGMKSADGKEIVDFHNCQAWNKKAELLEKYGRKGDRIVVEGTLQNNNYEKDGVKHYGYVINCSDIQLVETKKDRANGESTGGQDQEQVASPPATETSTDDDFTDTSEIGNDIPFFDA